jgi:hypothetical protein
MKCIIKYKFVVLCVSVYKFAPSHFFQFRFITALEQCTP